MTGKKSGFEAAYLETYRRGGFAAKITRAFRILESCTLCPRSCAVNRIEGERGDCGGGYQPKVSSYSPHFGEERPLVGFQGSGTIFMTHCNLGCSFCQNYSISHLGEGREVSFERFASIMVELERVGCHNINFVSPTQFVPQILKALPLAVEKGLTVPIVYNTGGYDALETIRLLDGVVDIYMPDFKYSSTSVAQTYSNAPDYPEVVKRGLKEMQRQVGDLSFDERGIARRGLLVRHLVLPNGLAGTGEAMHFLATEVSKNAYVNIMAQYYPCGDIPPFSPLSRRITQREYSEAVEAAKREGITRFDQ